MLMNAFVGQEILPEAITIGQGLKDEGSATPDSGKSVLDIGNGICLMGGLLPLTLCLNYSYYCVSVPVCCFCDLGSHRVGLYRAPPGSLESRSLLSRFTPLAHYGLTSLAWPFS